MSLEFNPSEILKSCRVLHTNQGLCRARCDTSGLSPSQPKRFKMIPTQNNLKRLRRLSDIHKSSSLHSKVATSESSECLHDKFVDTTW